MPHVTDSSSLAAGQATVKRERERERRERRWESERKRGIEEKR